MNSYLARLLAALPNVAPDADARFLYLKDATSPLQRDLRTATLEQLGGGGGSGGTGPFTAAEMLAFEAEAIAYSAAVARRNVDLTQPTHGLVAWIGYGQSLSKGAQSHPPISLTAPSDCYMIGNSTQSGSSTRWTPPGNNSALNPLIATVLNGNTVLTAEQIAALSELSGYEGESPIQGFVAQLRRAWLAYRGKPGGDPTNRWFAADCGSSGKRIEVLSKGATPFEYFQRVRDAIDKGKAIADANGWTYAVGGVYFDQGQTNYGNTTFETYAGLLAQLIADIREYAVSVTGQAGIIPVYIAQVGGGYAVDAGDLPIARAQTYVSRTVPGVFMATSTGPLPEKSDGHLAVNSSRQTGMQAGKVAARTIIEGIGWECTGPIATSAWRVRDNYAVGLWHVPVPPLTLGTAYQGFTPFAFGADQGLYFEDEAGANAVVSVSVFNGRLPVVRLTRASVGVPKVWVCRSNVYDGLTPWCDSDATPLAGRYTYDTVSGFQPSENIAALVGLSYSAANFSLADVQTATAV